MSMRPLITSGTPSACAAFGLLRYVRRRRRGCGSAYRCGACHPPRLMPTAPARMMPSHFSPPQRRCRVTAFDIGGYRHTNAAHDPCRRCDDFFPRRLLAVRKAQCPGHAAAVVAIAPNPAASKTRALIGSQALAAAGEDVDDAFGGSPPPVGSDALLSLSWLVIFPARTRRYSRQHGPSFAVVAR